MFLDIGIGILLAILTSKLFNLPLTAFLITSGIMFSLLADVDYLFYMNSNNIHRHRELFHHPLLYIPLGMAATSFFGIAWAILFGLCSLAHFIHDSIGIGWGVQWLYPFKKDHYSFFYIYKPRSKEKLPNRMIYTWKHEHIDAIDQKHGDPDWIKNVYWHWHPYAIIEFLTFLTALVILYFCMK